MSFIDVISTLWETLLNVLECLVGFFVIIGQVTSSVASELIKLIDLIVNSLGYSVTLIYYIFPLSWAVLIASGLFIAGFYKVVGRN